jgi:hypothetical protein
MKHRLPLGFFLCGVVSLCFSIAALLGLLLVELDPGWSWSVPLRGICVLLASLGVITTEALWKTRPAAYPASLALVVCYALSVLGIAVADPSLRGPGAGLLAVSALAAFPMLRYVHARSRQLWPPAGVRVPAPRP